jgi:NAD+-dependent secondary alcohol dehydrogenase Adh1
MGDIHQIITDGGIDHARSLAVTKAERRAVEAAAAVLSEEVSRLGIGHIGIQVLRALCAAEIVVVDRSDMALSLAKECGAHYVVKADGGQVEGVLGLTHGRGAESVIDFVGEGSAVAEGLAMTRNDGFYYVVGYGGKIELPTIDMITTEKTIVGNLVGTYPELVELMALADRGLVTLTTKEYRLSEANQALQDLHHGKIKGRAVLVP